MYKIYKYALENHYCCLKIPKWSQYLSVGMDCNEQLCVWFIVDPEGAEMDEICFAVLGTGWPVENLDGWQFLGTVKDQPYMWHIFMQK